MQHLKFSANFRATKLKTLRGKKYLVAPITLLKPGVLSGSRGPLYYPPEEIIRSSDAWNGVPVVLKHPVGKKGDFLSARDPRIFEKQEVGRIFRAQTTSEGKLRGEAWIDVERLKELNSTVLDRIRAGKPVEVSTGLYTEDELAPAGSTHNGVPYGAIARNYRPDHLAILPDEKGACSVEDGCGINVNLQPRSKNTGRYKRLGSGTGKDPVQAFAQGGAMAMTDKYFELGKDAKAQDEQGHNPPSWCMDEDLWEKAKDVVRKHIPQCDDFYACVTYIYERLGGRIGGLGSAKTHSAAGEQKMVNLTKEKRDSIIKHLTENCDCGWDKSDQELLNSLSDEKLLALYNAGKNASLGAMLQTDLPEHAKQFTWNENEGKWIYHKTVETNAKESEVEEEEEEEEEEESEEEKKLRKLLTKHSSSEGKTNRMVITEEMLSPEMREDLIFARQEKARQKAKLIEQLVANISDTKEKAEQIKRLQERTLEELQLDVRLLPEQKTQPSSNFVGALGLVENSSDEDPTEVLPLPKLQFNRR